MKIKIDVNRMQELFLCWNAERLGLSYQESIDRYGTSWQVYPHRGQDFRKPDGN